MAADDEFPRGWVYFASQAAGNTTLPIVVPGVAGVSHVLDSFSALGFSGGGTFLAQVLLGSSDGLYVGVPIGALYSPASGTDEASGESLGICVSIGASITVQVQPSAGMESYLMIQGHDI